MVELRRQQRAMFVDKLPDFANVAVGALVFGQFLGNGVFSPYVALAGLGLWIVFMGWAAFLAGGER